MVKKKSMKKGESEVFHIIYFLFLIFCLKQI